MERFFMDLLWIYYEFIQATEYMLRNANIEKFKYKPKKKEMQNWNEFLSKATNFFFSS